MSLAQTGRFRIPLSSGPVRSLCWQRDELVDWAGGGTRFLLDGSTVRENRYFAYRFDRAATSRDGKYAVIYEALGTKGLILQGDRLVREINRSYYHAQVYEYPITLFDLPDGRVAVAHCPEAYNRLEFEEIESGERLTMRSGESPDFFHSRLQISPDGAYLLSAGWVWHPLDLVAVYSVLEALKAPEVLDQPMSLDLPEELFGVHAGAFQEDCNLLLVGSNELEEAPPFAGRYNLKTKRIEAKCALAAVPGTVMPVGVNHFVGFYDHPRLFELSTGKIVQEWPDLETGKQDSSIMNGKEPVPPLAMDPTGHRFAVADAKGITAIQLG